MDQLVELTSKGCGCLLVIDEEYHLIGTFTDGDLRRTLKASGEGIFKLTVGQMCNRYESLILTRFSCYHEIQDLAICQTCTIWIQTLTTDAEDAILYVDTQ